MGKFVAERGIDRIDAIKLDVEGAELRVIRGADGTIRRFKPILMVELNEQALRAAGTEPNELLRVIVSYGYRAYVIRDGRALPTAEVVRPMGYRGNVATKQGILHYQSDNYLFLPQ